MALNTSLPSDTRGSVSAVYQKFVSDVPRFRSVLRSCDAVVFGPAALWLFTGLGNPGTLYVLLKVEYFEHFDRYLREGESYNEISCLEHSELFSASSCSEVEVSS